MYIVFISRVPVLQRLIISVFLVQEIAVFALRFSSATPVKYYTN